MWTLQLDQQTLACLEDGFIGRNYAFSGISLQCQKGSPCGNLLPRALVDPDFFFLIEISNSGTDNRPYCEHTSRFELHVFGFPLNPITALFCMLVSVSSVVLAVAGYVVYKCCWRNGLRLRSWVPQMYRLPHHPEPHLRRLHDVGGAARYRLADSPDHQGVSVTRGWFFSVVDA